MKSEKKTAKPVETQEQVVISPANEEAFVRIMQDAIQRPAVSWEEALGEEFKLIYQDPSQPSNLTPSFGTDGDTSSS